MRCPRGDGELIKRTTTGAGAIKLSYYLCLGCLGHWMSPFDANYFPSETLPDEKPEMETSPVNFRCPECNQSLERSHSDAISPGTLAWYCPSGHGFFFPRGNLRAFRAAQSARIAYHKLWNVPLPPLQSVLLATVTLLALTGTIVTFSALRQTQQTQSQASTLITYHSAVVTKTGVTLIARTGTATTLLVHSTELTVDREMSSTDGRTHTFTVPKVGPGTYTYSFSYEYARETFTSPTYTFVVE